MKTSKTKSERRTAAGDAPSSEERDRFGRLAKKLVNVPKREIDEKAKEWERDKRTDG